MSSTKTYVLPTKFPKTAIWLRGDMGKTIAYPSVTAPTDLTNVSWAKTSITTPDATTILASASTSAHYISQAISQITVGASTQISVEFWTGTYDYAFAQIGSNPNSKVSFQISTSTFITHGSGVSSYTITSLGGGHYRLDMTAPATTAATLYMGMTDVSGNNTFAAAGTESVHFTNISVIQAGVVSAWANQGNNTTLLSSVSQATFASMPLVSTTNNLSSLLYVAASSQYLSATFTGSIVQPFTLLAVLKPTTLQTAYTVARSSGSGEGIFYAGSAGTISMNCGVVLNSAGSAYSAGETFVAGYVCNGASSAIYKNGASIKTGDAGTNSQATIEVGAAAGGGVSPFDGQIPEVIIYAGDAVADGAFTPISNYLKTFWRIG